MKKIGFILLVAGFVFFGCDTGNGTNGFVSTVDTVSNDVLTLGLVGTSAISSNQGVATVEIVSGEIIITSISAGTSVITVSVGSNSATINITVLNNGTITRNIVKYAGSQNSIVGTWLCDDFTPERWFKFESDGTGAFDNDGTFVDPITFNYTYNGTVIVITNSSGPGAIPNGDYPAILAIDGLSLTISGDGDNQVFQKQTNDAVVPVQLRGTWRFKTGVHADNPDYDVVITIDTLTWAEQGPFDVVSVTETIITIIFDPETEIEIPYVLSGNILELQDGQGGWQEREKVQ